MAYDKIVLKNNNTGQTRTAPVGFSWTTAFFGPIPALMRRDYHGVLLQLFCAFVTFGVSAFIFPLIYNKRYLKALIQDGFIPEHTLSGTSLEEISKWTGVVFPSPPDPLGVRGLCEKAPIRNPLFPDGIDPDGVVRGPNPVEIPR
jgi:hypothetical protein